MAYLLKSLILLVLLFTVLSSFTEVTTAARDAPADHKGDEKQKKECLENEGTVLIPGIGRYTVGSHELPAVSGLDHSIPAAANAHYLPGADDTFVPNPGFEVPNPFRPGGP